MECNLLDAVINTCTTKSYKGFKRTGWITPLANIDPASVDIDGVTVKFGLQSGMFYEIYDDSANPFQGSFPTVEETANHGYKRFTGNVKFPVKPLSPEYAAIVTALSKNQQFVVILEQEEKGTADDSRYVVHGLQGGLYCTTPTYEMANDSVWEISMMEHNIDPPALFLYDTDAAGTAALKTLLTDYEYISGLTVAAGNVTPQYVNLKVTGTTLPCYNVMPDGTINTSTAGVITDTWDGAEGSVILIIPKDTRSLLLTNDVNAGQYKGDLICNAKYRMVFASYSNITTLNAPNAKYIYAANTQLTESAVKLILDNAYSLYLTGVVDGTIDLTGTTTIDSSQLSLIHGLTYTNMVQNMLDGGSGWTISFEEA